MIFLCMVLRRFPWTIADTKADHSFKSFVYANPDLCTRPIEKKSRTKKTAQILAPPSEKEPSIAVRTDVNGTRAQHLAARQAPSLSHRSQTESTASSEFSSHSQGSSSECETNLTTPLTHEKSAAGNSTDTSGSASISRFHVRPAILVSCSASSATLPATFDQTSSPEQVEDLSVLKLGRPAEEVESLPVHLSYHLDDEATPVVSQKGREVKGEKDTIKSMPSSPLTPTPNRKDATFGANANMNGHDDASNATPVAPPSSTSSSATPKLRETSNEIPHASNNTSSINHNTNDTPTPSKAVSRIVNGSGGGGGGGTGADSIFRLLPRESRSAIRRMMHVEPSGRCTLSDLLRGRGKGKVDGLRCLCGGETCGGGLNTPPHEKTEYDGTDEEGSVEDEEGDDGDEWLKGIETCSAYAALGKPAPHEHCKVPIDEKQGKKRFFL